MALIDITPIMTSDIVPSPYVVSASSVRSRDYSAYKAFDSRTSTFWRTDANIPTGYIQINFATLTEISAFSIVSSGVYSPKNFKLEGSNDGSIYEEIISIEGEPVWATLDTRTYWLSENVSYQYYRINVSLVNGGTYVQINDLKFYKEDSPVVPPENQASLRYTLPFGSKLRLDNLTSDLTYMLATEDDGENEGTLRIVNHAGKFIVPKAGQKKVTIWKGYANNISTSLILSDPITKFSSIIIKYSQWTQSNPSIMYVQLPIVDGKISGNIMLVTGSDARYMDISFTTDFNITFNQFVNSGTMTNIGIMEVIGIY